MSHGKAIHPRGEIIGFFGVTGLAFLLFAVMVERSRVFVSLLCVFLFVIFFTVRETGVAHLVYYLPGMDRFRHIAYVFSSVKWVAIVCAGFGLRPFTRPNLSSSDLVCFVLALGVVTLVFLASIPSSVSQGSIILSGATFRSPIVLLLLFGVSFGVLFAPLKEWRLVCVGIAVLELVLYRLFLPFPTQVDPSARMDFANVAPRAYQSERIWEDEAPRALQFEKETGLNFEHDMENAFLGIDLCGGSRSSLLYRSILITKPVQALLLTWKGTYEPSIDDNYRLLSILGCHAPKLRLVRSPIFAADATAAESAAKRNPDLYRSPIVISAQGDDSPSNDLGGPAGSAASGNPASTDIWSNATTDIGRMDLDPSGRAAYIPSKDQVKQFHANSITIDVNNPYPYAAWLVYADSYHTAWRALLDNAPAQILPTNFAFKGLRHPSRCA